MSISKSIKTNWINPKTKFPKFKSLFFLLILIGLNVTMFGQSQTSNASSTCGCKESFLQWKEMTVQDPNLIYEMGNRKDEYVRCLAECYYFGGNKNIKNVYAAGSSVYSSVTHQRTTIHPYDFLYAIAKVHCKSILDSEYDCRQKCAEIKPFAPCPTVRFQETQPECPEWEAYYACLEGCDKGSTQCTDNYFNYINKLFENETNASVSISSPSNGDVILFAPEQTTTSIQVGLSIQISGQQVKSSSLQYKGPEGAQSYYTSLSSSQPNDKVLVRLEGLGQHTLTLHVETVKGLKLTNAISISTIPQGVGSNLTIRKKDIELVFTTPDPLRPLEQRADQQIIKVTVHNRDTVEANNVYVHLSAGPSDGDGQILDSILIGTIPKESKRHQFYVWNLKGQNMENWRLYADAYIPNVADVSPNDNFEFRDFNIYYAHNGQKAFSLFDDTYNFRNTSLSDDEISTLLKRFIGYVASETFTISPTEVGDMEEMKKNFVDLWYPQLFTQYKNYLRAISTAGSGGLCHGYSASALDFFHTPSKNPFGKSLSAVTESEAGQIPYMYHLDQLNRFFKSAIETGQNYKKWAKPQSVSDAYHTLKNSLKQRQANIMSFNGTKTVNGQKSGWGHAILGYKLLEVDNEDPLVYTYDPNFPMNAVANAKNMSTLSFDENLSSWKINFGAQLYENQSSTTNSTYYKTKYLWSYPLRLNLSGEDIKFYLELYKSSISSFNDLLTSIDKYIIQLSCPADLVLTDNLGRKTGLVGGKWASEIPGVEIGGLGETEFYYVPNSTNLTVDVVGTGNGTARLTTIRSSGNGLTISAIDNLPLLPKSISTTTTSNSGKLNPVIYNNRNFPVVESFVSKADRIWEKLENANKKPIASFSIMPEFPNTEDDIILVSTSTDPEGDVLSYKWFLDDQLISSSAREIMNIKSFGNHKFTLVVTDSKGATSSFSKQVSVKWVESSWFKIEQSTKEEIKQWLPMILGGLLVLVLVYFLGLKNKKKKINTPLQESQEPPTTKKNINHFCTQCGKPLTPGNKFCNHCGNKL
ncbi:MAG: zinc-ribbon domain-containing protein [Saprospiraceae bacterium]|nr:zinc-ribbon domain-containing protein [Saprospiraceae bacterium]